MCLCIFASSLVVFLCLALAVLGVGVGINTKKKGSAGIILIFMFTLKTLAGSNETSKWLLRIFVFEIVCQMVYILFFSTEILYSLLSFRVVYSPCVFLSLDFSPM